MKPWLLMLFAVLVAPLFSACTQPPGPAPAPTSTLHRSLEPCDWPGYNGEVLCSEFEVWENRDAASGRTLRLKIAILPATGPEPEKASDATTLCGSGRSQPAASWVVLPGLGHDDFSPCGAELVATFIRDGKLENLDRSCSEEPYKTDFRIASR